MFSRCGAGLSLWNESLIEQNCLLYRMYLSTVLPAALSNQRKFCSLQFSDILYSLLLDFIQSEQHKL